MSMPIHSRPFKVNCGLYTVQVLKDATPMGKHVHGSVDRRSNPNDPPWYHADRDVAQTLSRAPTA